jgi:hypothetical protein
VSFTVDLGSYLGRESCFEAKDSATVFYTSSNGGGRANAPGLVGWEYEAGHVVSFSTLIGVTELDNMNYSRLFVNTVNWASQTP